MAALCFFVLLEAQSHLRLHDSAAGLVGDRAEVGGFDGQGGIARLWMVQHILGVNAELETLGFGNLESLSEVGIEAPAAQTNNGVVAQVAFLAWLGVLEDDLHVLSIRQKERVGRTHGNHHGPRIKIAVPLEAGVSTGAKWIGYFHEGIAIVEVTAFEEVAVADAPARSLKLVEIDRMNDIGPSIAV